jgi:uncharacterized protein YodC (DUF2158 family)
MVERYIPDNDAQKFTTIDGRKELMRNYKGIYAGVNTDGERIVLAISPTSMELTTFQSDGWVRINWYNADGLPAGETFEYGKRC